MKKIVCWILALALVLTVGGGVVNPENVNARMGVDIYGNYVENNCIYQPTDDPVYYYQPPVDENGNHDYFGYPVYDDPQDITDEEFFGKWSHTYNRWLLEPYFRYSEFPGMAKVEAAAKAGDYETAKAEIKEYYISIANERTDTRSYGTITPLATTILEGLSRNIYSYTMISAMSIGGFEIPADEWSKVELDVLNEVDSAKSAYPDFNIEVASADKFWTTAQIYSKDAADPSLRPVLRMVINGVVTERCPYKDAMVVAGSESGTNYGFDEIIDLQEHGTYDDIGEPHGNFDENTKRAFFCFDISDIKDTDTIKSAKVIFTARSVITDDTREKFSDEDGTPYSNPARDKTMWATWYKDSAWKEGTLTWNTNTVLDKMYFSCNDMEAWDYISSKNPNIKGKVCDFHRDNSQSNLRTAWMITHDERYAYTYIRQEMALINSIGCEPNVMNSLDMSTHMTGVSSSFYAMLNSKYFSADVCTAWLKFMWQLCDWQVENYYGTSNNNWGTFATSAVYNGVARFPEYATHDYWYQRTLEDNTRMLSGFVLEDGLCIEQSHNYVTTLLGTMNTPLTTMVHTGHEAPYEEQLYEDIYDCVQTLIFTSGPYFGGFNQGDGYDPYKSYKSTFKTWYQTWFPDDENLLWLVSGGTSGRMPENPTTVYPTSYKTFMRSGWDEKSLQLAFINVSDSKRSHHHDDQLSFAMFAYGKYLLVDPGYGGDQTGDGGRVWKYNKSPVQHNLVTINDTYDYLYDGVCAATTVSANSSGSRDFETNKYYDYQEYYNTGYNTSPLMQRSITFLKDSGFWIVSDYNVPNNPSKENVFAQHWHTAPDADMTYDDNLAVRTNYDGPNVNIVPVEHDELDGVQWVDCYYSEASGQKIVAQKAMYTKTHTGNGRFTTLIIPENIGDSYDVLTSSVKNESGIDDSLINGAYFRISDKNTGEVNYYFYYHINDEYAKTAGGVKIGDYTTDATTLVVQTDVNGEVVSLFVVNGTFVKDASVGDKYLFKNQIPTTMSYKKSGGFINIFSSMYDDAKDLNGTMLYSPDATAVRLDGDELKADFDGGVITLLGSYVADYILGDVDGNGTVTTKDRIILSRHLADWIGYEEIDNYAADVNLDGDVTTMDRIILSRHLADWIGYEILPYNRK